MNIGERVGDYEIVEVLGAGGMGQVFKVRNLLSERIEAMKVVLPNLESDPGLADRFLREIKVQAALDHPNIAKLHTAMRSGNQLLMFMEFVEGISLAKRMERGPVPPGEAAAISAQVLDALAHAHANGVVHRDIKPANIMITGSGVVKLLDFGIARMQADKRLTKTGTAVGSLFYMSPEQIRGAEPDQSSDIYSLGIVLYEMVTGRRPFGGDSDFQIMAAHLEQVPVPPIQAMPGVPPELSEIILMAIAKEPGARFQSAAAFRAALVNAFPETAPSVRGAAARTMTPIAAPRPPAPPPAMAAAPPPLPPPMPPPIGASKPAPEYKLAPPPPPALPLPPPKPNRRGLYMTLGSVATLAVLLAAGIEGPKLIHGGVSRAEGTGTAEPSTATPAPAASPAAAPDPATSAAPAAPEAPPAASPSSSPSVSNDTAAHPAQRVTPLPGARTSPSSPSAAVPSAAGAAASVLSSPPQGNAAPPPASQSVAPPAVPQAPPAAPQPPRVNPPANQEAAELRDQYNELTIRANTARAGLRSFEQQQSRQGLGLRADIREAQTRLDYQLQEAMSSLRNGDMEGTRRNLRYAQSAVETIEKFLGR
jgi:serine/threonine protein kinase